MGVLLSMTLLASGSGLCSSRDVIDHVWTPTKDRDGSIIPASIAELPVSTYENQIWVEVANTNFRQLEKDLVTAMGGVPLRTLNHGNGDITMTANAWVGGAEDQEGGRFFIPWGGGHADSSLNMVYHLDINRMGGEKTWIIDQLPSDPNSEAHPWSDQYKRSGSFTIYAPSSNVPSPPDILPDGKPTSRHQYQAVWYDPKRDTVNQYRVSHWIYDLKKNSTYRQQWSQDGAPYNSNAPGNILFYNEFQDSIYGYLKRNASDYYNWVHVDPNSGISSRTQGPVVGANASNGWTACRMWDRDKLLFIGNDYTKNVDQWFTYDMRTQKRTGALISPGGLSYHHNSEMSAQFWVPQWQKAIRRVTIPGLTGRWFALDLETSAQVDITHHVSGRVPPMTRQPGNKVFYYKAWKAVIYISPKTVDQNAVYVMRVE
jgi:hypothetical protein